MTFVAPNDEYQTIAFIHPVFLSRGGSVSNLFTVTYNLYINNYGIRKSEVFVIQFVRFLQNHKYVSRTIKASKFEASASIIVRSEVSPIAGNSRNLHSSVRCGPFADFAEERVEQEKEEEEAAAAPAFLITSIVNNRP